jgi:L-aminopeptidase/D-esterase-like protein
VHASLSRAIQPFHALVDGDVLSAVTTNEVDNEELTTTGLGVVASELAGDAVLASVAEPPALRRFRPS